MSRDPVLPSLAGVARGIDHLTLPVADLAVAERFYCGLLGARVVMRVDEAFFQRVLPERVAELSQPHNSPLHLSLRMGESPQLDLFLHRGEPVKTRPHPHLAFGISGADVERVRERLDAAGVAVDGPRRLGPPGQASLYFQDPFGNLLEFAASDYTGPVTPGAPDLARLPYSWKG